MLSEISFFGWKLLVKYQCGKETLGSSHLEEKDDLI